MSIKRVLMSVSDKTGLLEFARELVDMGAAIISTGGTFKALKDAGLPVTYISDVTEFPEILDGRVKTLHPAIHGGLLAVRDLPEHMEQLNKQGIEPIDMVVCNLYPFEAAVSKADVTLEEAIENIDIGGPSMVRSAAKNHKYVAIVVNPKAYAGIIDELKENGGELSLGTKQRLAVEAYEHTAAYDTLISGWLKRNMLKETDPSDTLSLTYRLKQNLRYGENPHQKAEFYIEPMAGPWCVANAEQLGGKELSYCNIMDADATLQIIREFDDPAVVAVKHTNPCGVGIGADIFDAWIRAYEADPVSIFGGIIALNRPVDARTAKAMSKIFLEIIIAPAYDDDALEILTKKKNLRVLKLDAKGFTKVPQYLDTRRVVGGLLVQGSDYSDFDPSDLKVVTKRIPTEKETADMLFGWKIVKHVKSNAIVVVKDNVTLGVGAGQMNRVGSAKIAFETGGEACKGAALASDALIPMPDTVIEAANAGITAIIQTGGSVKDAEVIQAADELGIAMVFTGYRHFKH